MTSKYDQRIDFARDDAHTRVIRLVGEKKRVLEVGSASGYMSRVLVERFGCTVVGVEADPAAAETARTTGQRVVVGDIETLDLKAALGEERFDVVVCADVLEHLRDPVVALARLRPFLGPDSYLVASIPNIAHLSVIAELVAGRFPYRPLGLLDESHLRFFTRESIFRCLEQAGFVVTHLETVRVEPDQTEFRTDLDRLPPEVVQWLRAHEDSTAYQFVLTARIATEGRGTPVLRAAFADAAAAPTFRAAGTLARDTTEVSRFQSLLAVLMGRMTYLEDERQHQTRNRDDLQARLDVSTAERNHWQRVARAATEERDRLQAQADAFGREVYTLSVQAKALTQDGDRLRDELSRIQSGAGWALLARYRRARLALIPTNSRRERVYVRGLGILRRLGRAGSATTPGLARRLQRASFLVRTGRAIYRTQGARELVRQAWVYARSRTPDRETLPLTELRAWFARHGRPVAVVIPTYRQTTLVSRCVESILEGLSGEARARVRLIVVDDGSPPDVQEYLRQLPAQLIARPQNEGFARTVNAGLEATTNEDVVLLNNDTVAHPGWLEALQYCASRQPRIGILGPKLLYPDGRIQSAGSYRSTDQPRWFDHCYRFAPSDHPPANIEREVLAVTGACMYIKRGLLDQLGPLDPGFAMAFEDVDYCLRAREAGYGVSYCPHATLTHLEGHTRGERQEAREVRAQDYFWEKWGGSFDGRRVWATSRDALSLMYVVQDTGVAGGHKVIFEHLNRLRTRGHDVELYALSGPPKWFPLRVPVRTFPSYETLVEDLAARDAIKVATWWETADPVWRASLRRGVPAYLVQDIEISYYAHEPVLERERARVMASYRKEFHYLTDATWTQRQLAGLGLSATMVNPGIDHQVFRPLGLPRPGNVVLSVGRSHPLKNIDLLFKALQRLERPPALHLFGIEPGIGKGIATRYAFDPSDGEIARLYNAATVFVLPSLHEGYGIPILEAMACGCPVVCTDADGNMDFCTDGQNCLIVPKDDPDRLAKTLSMLLADTALQEQLRQAGLATVREFTWEQAIAQVEAFYRTIADDRSRLLTR